jgi:hypothetical protein
VGFVSTVIAKPCRILCPGAPRPSECSFTRNHSCLTVYKFAKIFLLPVADGGQKVL